MRAMHNYHSRARATLRQPAVSQLRIWRRRYVELAQIDRSESRGIGRHRGGCAGPVGLVAAAEQPCDGSDGFNAPLRLKFSQPGGNTTWQEARSAGGCMKPTSRSIPIRHRSARSQDRTPRAKTSIIRRPRATMPRAAIHTPPLLVLSQTSNRAAHPRQYIPSFETRRRSRRVFCVELARGCTDAGIPADQVAGKNLRGA